MVTNFVCSRCNKEINHESDFSTGYGRDDQNNKICYQCCGELDLEYMLQHEKITLYLNLDKQIGNLFEGRVTNWPGTISAKVRGRTGRHNIAGVRYDVYFAFDGRVWHGVTYGDNTQICHCKKTKSEDFYGLATLRMVQ